VLALLIVFTGDVHGRPELSSKDVKELQAQLSDYGIDYKDDVWKVLADHLNQPDGQEDGNDDNDYNREDELLSGDVSEITDVVPLSEVSKLKNLGQVTDVEEIDHLIPLNGEKTKKFLKKEGLDGEVAPNHQMASGVRYRPDGLSRILKLFDIDSLDQIKSVQPIDSIQDIDEIISIEDMAHIEDIAHIKDILPVEALKKLDPKVPLADHDLEDVMESDDTQKKDEKTIEIKSAESYDIKELETLSGENDYSREIPDSRQMDSDTLEIETYDDIRLRDVESREDFGKLVEPLEKLIEKESYIDDVLEDKYMKVAARLKAIEKVRQKHKAAKSRMSRQLKDIHKLLEQASAPAKRKLPFYSGSRKDNAGSIEVAELDSVSAILEMDKIDEIIPLVSMKEVKRIIPLTDSQAEKLREMASVSKFRPDETETAAAAEAKNMIARRRRRRRRRM